MKIETVAEAFADYQERVIPTNAPHIQIDECRRAFFAGAYFLLMELATGIGDDSTSEEDGIVALEQLKMECEAFAVSVRNDPAPAAPSVPEMPDISYNVDNAEIRPLLQELGDRIGSGLPDGWGFNLLLFEYGEGEGKGLFYISSARRADVIAVMKEYIKRQTQ